MGDLDDLRGRTLGEFIIRERIGEGGFGAVYRCEQPLLGREAVIKVLHHGLRGSEVVLQRFMREAQLASRLDHPYAAHVYAFGVDKDDGLFWIAMEMVQGTGLDRWLRDRGKLPLDQLVPFFERVAEVVQTAHERGIVHRDLKPSNIMVIERAGRLLPKLLDFGIAKLHDTTERVVPVARGSEVEPTTVQLRVRGGDAAIVGQAATLSVSGQPLPKLPSQIDTLPPVSAVPSEAGHAQPLTQADATLGSPPYMSPEQWLDPLTVGPRSDLYALAIVAYEALAGRRPFSATTITALADLHCNGEVPSIGPNLPPALDAFFKRALAKRALDRPANALELAAELRIAAGLGTDAIDLPRLDDGVRDVWLADGPQHLAESIAALDSARNVHQARDGARELFRALIRYLLALALAARAQVRGERDELALRELLRALPRRDLDDTERVRMLRLLVRPFESRRGAYPIPELVDLVLPSDGRDALDRGLALHLTSDVGGSETHVRSQLAQLTGELTRLLRATTFLFDYPIVVTRDSVSESWMGVGRHRRVLAAIRDATADELRPVLLDRDGRTAVLAWPLVQLIAPSTGAELELFVFDGRGRHGARLISSPAAFEHHDADVWDWLGEHVIGVDDSSGDTPTDERTPYLGLASFSAADADRFVGREREIDAFSNRLRQRPLQVVVGASGAGKSSFVHAGVIPSLPSGWRAITMRPGSEPLANLASRLAAAGVSTADLRPLLEVSAAAAATLINHAAGDGAIVIVVDQLEELFTLCSDAQERERFATVLAQLTSGSESKIRVVCTVRDDFLMNVESLAPLRAALSPALYLLGNPSRDDLVRTIVEPARRAGYELSDAELASDMVAAVADRPGALALLSFTASRLWELRDRRFRQLTRRAYDAMGGVGGALGQHAEATLAAMSVDEHKLARETFRNLVTAEATRAVLSVGELRQRLASHRAEATIEKLVAARLLAIVEGEGQPQVEIIHEALISAWPRLQSWVREDSDNARMREQLRAAAKQWDERKRPRGSLWRDDVLAELDRWRRSGAVLTDVELAFANASRADSVRARRARRVLAVAAFAAVATFALFQFRAARLTSHARELAEHRTAASYVEQGRHALLDGKHTEALLYLMAAGRIEEPSPAVRFMIARAARPLQAERLRLDAKTGRMWSAAFSPRGDRIVTTDDASVRIWDAATGRLVNTLLHPATVARAAFNQAGSRFVTAALDGVIEVWAADGTSLHTLTHKDGDKTFQYAFATMLPGDERTVVAMRSDGSAFDAWDVDTQRLLASGTTDAAFSLPNLATTTDGLWLAVTGGGAEVHIVDTHTWQTTAVIAAEQVASIAIDPTGLRLVTAGWTGEAAIWDIPTGKRLATLQGVGDKLDHVAYSPDGKWIVTASRDGHARVWNSETAKLQVVLGDHLGGVAWAEFDASSRLVLTAGGDGVVTVSERASGHRISTFEGPRAPIAMAHFDPSSRHVIAAYQNGVARTWEVEEFYRTWTTQEIEECGIDIATQEDSRFLALACANAGTLVWDTAKGVQLASLPSVSPAVIAGGPAPALAATGDRVAIPSGNTVTIYELPGGRPVRTIDHPSNVTSVALSPTGRDVASASEDGTLLISAETRAPRPAQIDHVGIETVVFTPDGLRVVVAQGSKISVYDVAESHSIVSFDNLVQGEVGAFRFSADGRRALSLASRKQPAAPVLWDLVGRRRIGALVGHDGQVFSGRFVNHDREILTAGTDGVVRLWDAATGELVKAFASAASTFVLDAAIDVDGLLVTAGGDGWLRFFDASSGQMIWGVQAHRTFADGVHFDGESLISHGWNGDIARWRLDPAPSADELAVLTSCAALDFDDETGELVTRKPCKR